MTFSKNKRILYRDVYKVAGKVGVEALNKVKWWAEDFDSIEYDSFLLDNAFTWCDTKNGSSFWLYIHQKIQYLYDDM